MKNILNMSIIKKLLFIMYIIHSCVGFLSFSPIFPRGHAYYDTYRYSNKTIYQLLITNNN